MCWRCVEFYYVSFYYFSLGARWWQLNNDYTKTTADTPVLYTASWTPLPKDLINAHKNQIPDFVIM